MYDYIHVEVVCLSDQNSVINLLYKNNDFFFNERVCRDIHVYQNRKKHRNKIGMVPCFSHKIKYHFHITTLHTCKYPFYIYLCRVVMWKWCLMWKWYFILFLIHVHVLLYKCMYFLVKDSRIFYMYTVYTCTCELVSLSL